MNITSLSAKDIGGLRYFSGQVDGIDATVCGNIEMLDSWPREQSQDWLVEKLLEQIEAGTPKPYDLGITEISIALPATGKTDEKES